MAFLAPHVHAVLLDIEGTISPTRFVRDVLFDYSRRHLATYIDAHRSERETAAILVAAAALSGGKEPVAALRAWQERDEKAPPLKAIQGLIWEDGYVSGAFRAPIFADALTALRHWREAGLPLHVYSSGSLKAQDLFFRFNEAGDLRGLFNRHFDSGIGPKIDPQSYLRISRALDTAVDEILFLSDDARELSAARAAGLQVAQIVKDDTAPDPRFPAIVDFSEIELTPRSGPETRASGPRPSAGSTGIA